MSSVAYFNSTLEETLQFWEKYIEGSLKIISQGKVLYSILHTPVGRDHFFLESQREFNPKTRFLKPI